MSLKFFRLFLKYYLDGRSKTTARMMKIQLREGDFTMLEVLILSILAVIPLSTLNFNSFYLQYT